MVQTQQRTISTTKTWTGSAANGNEFDLPTDFLIQKIIIDFSGDIDTSGAGSTAVEDALQAVISRIKLDATGKGGSKTIFDMSGADLYHKNFFDYSTPNRRTVVTAASQTDATIGTSLIIDFRLDKKNNDDWSVAIPAWLINTLKLTLDFDTAANGYGTNTSNASVTATVTLVEGIPQANENFSNQPLLTSISTEHTLSNATGVEKLDNHVSVGGVIRKIYFVAKTNAGARSDIQVDDLTIKTGNVTILEEVQYEALIHQNIMDYSLPNFDGNFAVKGWFVADFTSSGSVDSNNNVLGYNAVNLKQGDIKIHYDKLVAQPKIRVIQETVEA